MLDQTVLAAASTNTAGASTFGEGAIAEPGAPSPVVAGRAKLAATHAAERFEDVASEPHAGHRHAWGKGKGHWKWAHGEYMWIAGRWLRVRVGHRQWIPGRWISQGHDTHWVDGHWTA